MDGILQPGMVVPDVGAIIGEITITVVRRIGSNGDIHEFEPMRSRYCQLTEHQSMNGMHQVAPMSRGRSDRIGAATIGYTLFLIGRKPRLRRLDEANVPGTQNVFCVPVGGEVP